MSDEIIKVLDNLAERFGIAIDWTNENAMPYLQDLMSRFVNYKIGISIMWLVILVIILIISTIVGYKCLKGFVEECKKSYCEQDEGKWILCLIGTIIAVGVILASIIDIPYNIEDIIKATTVPEMVVYEYIKTLM